MTTIGTIAIILYAIAWLLLALRWRARFKQTEAPSPSKHYLWVWLVAASLHAAYLYSPLISEQHLSLDFISAASHVMWLAGQVLLITAITHRLESLNLFTLPFIAIALLAQVFLPLTEHSQRLPINGLGVHILSALLAYSMLMIAAIQAIILAYQHIHLHNHKPNAFLRTLPALQDMDSLLFRFIKVGVLLLSITLVTGFIYLENFFGAHVAHKTVLSIIAWLVFSALLVGRWRYGWRGISATRWTLSGFGLLMLAFFGTKFVQEYLLTS